MKIDNLSDLKKLLRLLRQEGVETFELGDIKLNLGPEPFKPERQKKALKNQPVVSDLPGIPLSEDGSQIMLGSLTEEQLLMWSVGQDPTQEGN